MDLLPDLDSGQEIYETSDVDSVNSLRVGASEPHSQDIDTDKLNTLFAHNKFEENMLEDIVDHADFSGSLVAEKQGRNSYRSKRWIETRSQRIARIAQELKELEEDDDEATSEIIRLREALETQVQSGGKDGIYSEQIKSVFSQVDEQLALFESSEESDKQKASYETSASQQSSTSTSHQPSAGRILDIESRINELEQAIGTSEISKSANIQLHLRDLDRKVNVLYNPEYEMDAMKIKVSELNKELVALAKTRRMAQLALPDDPRATHSRESDNATRMSHVGSFERKVDTLFSKLDDIEHIGSRLPAVISRLRSLHETHNDLAAAVSTVSDLDNTLESLKSEMQSWNSSLEIMRKAVDEQAGVFDTKVQDTETKLQHMEARVDALVESRRMPE